MDRFFFDRCRAAFIRWELRRQKQERLDLDATLRMQSQFRIGQLRAIQMPGEFMWTIWKEGNRGLLIPASGREFTNLSDAVDYLQKQFNHVAKVD